MHAYFFGQEPSDVVNAYYPVTWILGDPRDMGFGACISLLSLGKKLIIIIIIIIRIFIIILVVGVVVDSVY